MDVIQTAGTGRHGNSCSVARGPVCGVMVDTHTVKRRHTHHGDPFYFCASDCLEEFAANPTLYLKSELRSAKPSPEGKPVPEGTIYTCPMHPEIRKAGPGSCPICGMALEPELASAGAAPNPELIDMTRRFWIGPSLTAQFKTALNRPECRLRSARYHREPGQRQHA